MFSRIDSLLGFLRMSKKNLSALVDIPYSTLLQKLSGSYPFTLDEAILIHTALLKEAERQGKTFSDSIEVLFTKDIGVA